MGKKDIIQKNSFIFPITDGKLIEEHFGNITDRNTQISIAHIVSTWLE